MASSEGSDQSVTSAREVNLEKFSADSSGGINSSILKATAATYNSLVYASSTSEEIKGKLLHFTDDAAAELKEKASSGSPLWGLDDLGEEHLDKEIYKHRFTPNNQRREELSAQILHGALNITAENQMPFMMNTLEQPLTLEASRASETIQMKPNALVNMFMDVDQWSAMFSNVVSRATILSKIVEDGNPDDSILVMKAEFCLPTPYPITRECYFVRRSKKVNENIWLVVDVSLEIPCSRYLRKPSGCLIEHNDDGFTKVTIVEHNELILEGYLPVIFQEQVSSGFAFRASRWITMLRHQIEYQYFINQHLNDPSGGRSNILKLAKRMSETFMRNVNSSTEKTWKSMTGCNAEQLYVSNEYFENHLGRPDGNVVRVATSVSLPFTPDKLYDSLQCAECHPKWDIAILGACAKKELRILIGNDPSNHVSVLDIKIHGVDAQKCLQACFTDSNGMYIIWTFLKTETMNAIMGGGDPDAAGILVSGAVVLPWNPKVEDRISILTASFESLVESEGALVQEDVPYLDITKAISLVKEICMAPYEDHGGDEDEI